MRNVTCVGTETSKVPTRVTLLSIFYSVTGITFERVGIMMQGKGNVLMVSLSCGIVSDVYSVFQTLQKYFQKVCIVLPDIVKHRDIALLKFRSMLGTPFAGGSEETWVKENGALDADKSGRSVESSRQAKRTHTLIGCYHREQPFTTIRNEIINAAINFLEQRLDNEQEGIMKNIVDICGAKSIVFRKKIAQSGYYIC